MNDGTASLLLKNDKKTKKQDKVDLERSSSITLQMKSSSTNQYIIKHCQRHNGPEG